MMTDSELDTLAVDLHQAWRRYEALLGEPPHGTMKQLRALVELLASKRPCPWCDEGFRPIQSSATEVWVHPDTPVGRVVCFNREKKL